MSSHPMIPVPQAIRTVLTETAFAMVKQGVQTEAIFISDQQSLMGRIAAETIKASEIGYPPYNASVMDGYAVDVDEIAPLISSVRNSYADDHSTYSDHDSNLQFHVCDRLYAGPAKKASSSDDPIDYEMTEYISSLPKAIYVTTGAVIPAPYNAVIPVEEVGDSDGEHDVISIHVSNLASIKRNLWIRPIGCDIRPFTTIIEKGEVIEAVHIGLLVQCAIKEVKVTQLHRVGILSTGNELISHNEVEEKGAEDSMGIIPDANGPVLCSLLTSYGNCRPVHLGIVKDDDEDILTSVLDKSMNEYDVIVTTGGISMGEMDVIEKVLVNNLGCVVHFGRLHMKPGKPTTFLTVDIGERKCLIFALPGNPVSSMVCSELLIRPCLDMLHQGSLETIPSMVQNANVHPEVTAQLQDNVKLDVVRPEYHRVQLSYEFNNENQGLALYASSTGVQRSSRLMSIRRADGFMLLPQGVKGGKTMAEGGEIYPVILTRRPYGNSGIFSGAKVKDSIHLGGTTLTVGVVEVIGSRSIGDDIDDIGKRLLNVLGHDKFMLIENQQSNLKSFSGVLRKMNKCLDVIFVVGIAINWTESMDLKSQLRMLIHKEAESMAYLLREGAAYGDPSSILFDPIVGISNYDHNGCLIISLPDNGLEGALESARGLLKKTLSIVRGSNR